MIKELKSFLVPFMVALLILLVATGCARTEYVERPIYITKYRTIDDQYLTYCPIVPPPAPEEYRPASCEDRVVMLMDVYARQLERTSLRNVKMDELIEQNQYLDQQHNQDVEPQ